MIIEIVSRVGGPPVVLEASQFVVRNDQGTPISVGAVYGPDDTDAVSCVGCSDFQRMLRVLGINTTVIVNRLAFPKPQPGAVLVAGPQS